jgi:phosphatidylethanolamine-binding protein (PEBP) family uncharacterized protein
MGDNALAHDPSVNSRRIQKSKCLVACRLPENSAIFGPSVGLHRYFFKLYALDSKLSLKASPAKAEAEKAMQGHILGQGELVGRYRR